jgi:hypothetical protein
LFVQLGNAPPVAQAMEDLIMMHVQRTLLMECDDDVATLRERYSRLSDRLPGSLLQSPPGTFDLFLLDVFQRL